MVHSMLSGTASMDFGGKRAAATAAGMFDGMQYVGGAVMGWGMGWMLDRFGWGTWGAEHDRLLGDRRHPDALPLERPPEGRLGALRTAECPDRRL